MTSGSGDRRIFPGRDNASSRLMERSLNEPPARSGHVRRKLENGGTGMTSMLRKFRGAGVVAALIAGLALSACANKANDLLASAGVATPGSQQDFVVNVGDRVFFDSDSTELTPRRRAARSTSRRSGCSSTATTPSRSKATPTSAARANTTSRSAPAARRRCAIISPRAASTPAACAPCPTARSVRSRSATTSRAGRRTAAP